MPLSNALYQATVSSLPLLARGKVRDIYDINADYMLIVTTDRLSAFDVILPDPIPGKGGVLTRVANFWFKKTAHLIPNHLADLSLADVIPDAEERAPLEGRSIIVKKLTPLPIEAIIRGYLIGSGWKDYQATGTLCGIILPTGLQQAEQLPTPLYTPSSKAELGHHDENISFAQTVDLVGLALATQIKELSLQIYQLAADHAKQRGIIIADTKFEFGVDKHGVLHLIDEVLTPDSSRFWPADQYQIGLSPPSFDKQYVRDYLETLAWDKHAPGPHLPGDVSAFCAAKYQEAERRLTE